MEVLMHNGVIISKISEIVFYSPHFSNILCFFFFFLYFVVLPLLIQRIQCIQNQLLLYHRIPFQLLQTTFLLIWGYVCCFYVWMYLLVSVCGQHYEYNLEPSTQEILGAASQDASLYKISQNRPADLEVFFICKTKMCNLFLHLVLFSSLPKDN